MVNVGVVAIATPTFVINGVIINQVKDFIAFTNIGDIPICQITAAAKKLLAEFQVEVQSGEYIAPEKMKFCDFVGEWKEKYAMKELSPLTFKTYGYNLKNHILPEFGHMRIDQIKPMHIITFLDNLSRSGARKDGKGEQLSSGTIEVIYRTIKNVLNRAKDWDLINKHPMEGIKKPKVEKQELNYYDENEAQFVIEALYNEPIMWRLFILGAMIGGLRRGELLGLEWSDIDFDQLTITVNKSISLTNKKGAIIKEPKTEKSKRKVDMPEWYLIELKEYQTEWKLSKQNAEESWEGGNREFIFHGGLGKPLYHTYPSEWWKKFIKRHGLKYIRFHDLRHSSATILIENDVSLKAIQERLGHSNYNTTADIYAHVTKKISRQAAEKFDKFNTKAKKS
ncbi:tyrosine-type recombinase/integrase [Chengkuizengella sediminis]|uniref:tyrosine-type recombinase/integrase n=1 Tax=Chengkuizengella sediminis TaxID=1885917 RepID=UPI001F10287B|nr:site-specific integrase [Chengkuizengella sediminis]